MKTDAVIVCCDLLKHCAGTGYSILLSNDISVIRATLLDNLRFLAVSDRLKLWLVALCM